MKPLPCCLNGLFQFIRIHPLWVEYNYVQGLKLYILIIMSRGKKYFSLGCLGANREHFNYVQGIHQGSIFVFTG